MLHPESPPENQAAAEVDVFFIHPTILFTSDYWNADLADTALNRQVDDLTIRHQASVFNHQARVFAPRYRQMTYEGFLLMTLSQSCLHWNWLIRM